MARFRSQDVQYLIQKEKESADRIARENSKAGLQPILQVARTNILEAPRFGGSTGYPTWFRIQALELARATNPHYAAAHCQVSLASLYRWSTRIEPFRQTGNARRSVLTGYDQLLLTLAIYINPRSNADEISAYIARNGGGIYTRRQVYKRFRGWNFQNVHSSIIRYLRCFCWGPRVIDKERAPSMIFKLDVGEVFQLIQLTPLLIWAIQHLKTL